MSYDRYGNSAAYGLRVNFVAWRSEGKSVAHWAEVNSAAYGLRGNTAAERR